MNNFHIFSKPVDHKDNIINLGEYTGRINLVQPPDKQLHFDMIEKISIKNKSTDYRGALNGELEERQLSKLYFSAENIQIIQNALKSGVFTLSKERYKLPNQNVDNLKIVMRSFFLDYAKFHPDNITKQIEELNKLVIDYSVPKLYNEAVSYEKYCYDQSTMAKPLELQKNVDRDFKQLEIKPFV